MLRQPLARVRQAVRRTAGRRVVKIETLPAPTGGWNARDPIESMPLRDAVQLDDWFPEQGSVRLRPGYDEHCDTAEGTKDVAVLIPFRHSTYEKLIAACDGVIYDVTTSTPSSLASGLTSNDWSYTYLGGKVIMCNGADVVKSYDGSAIASPAFSGVTLSNLNQCTAYKSRIYFVEKQTKKMWYGGTGAVSGALTSFDFSTVISAQGNLKIVARLAGDGGDGGSDDVFVAIFEGGTVAAYTGSDPGDAANWSLLGVYQIGEPLSRLGHIEAEDDLYIVTSRGYERLSDVIKFGRNLPTRRLLSDKIQKAVATAVKTGNASDKWRMHIYPNGQMMMVTVPLSGSRRVQHVRNINTGAWCRFTIPAISWAQLGTACYFGSSDGKVYRFDNSNLDDNGSNIRGIAQPAWTYLGYAGYQKEVKMLRPFFTAESFPSTAINVGSDFETISTGQYETAGASPDRAIWGSAVWGTSTWSAPLRSQKRWVTRPAVGDAIGVKLTVETSTLNVSWNALQVSYVLGGPI